MGRIFPFKEPLGFVPFHNRTQKLALDAKRFRSISFGSETEHTPNARPQTLRCTGAWWPESSPQREGKQERKLETGTSRSIHHGERMCPVHSPNVWPHGWCRLKICNSGLCRRNEIWSLLCRICCQLLAVGGRTAGDFAEEERVRR
jgi:hypothetical protein